MSEKNTVTEISVSDIIKMFKGKGKVLICIAVIFAILGSGAILFKAMFFGDYGGAVKFYVTHSENYGDLLYLLRSESFAEKLILDENGLPPEEFCDAESYKRALDAVDAYKEGRQRVIDALAESEAFNYSVELPDGSFTTWTELSNEYKRLDDECRRITELLTIYKSANADAVAEDPNHVIRTGEYEELLESALAEKTKFENEIYKKSLDRKNALEQNVNKEFFKLSDLRNEAQARTEELLVLWREDAEVKSLVSVVKKSINVSYDKQAKNDKETEENCAFINIDVSVKGDRETAKYIIERLHKITPAYVETTAEKYVKNINTDCMLITPFSSVRNMSTSGIFERMAKVGILSCIVSLMAYGCLVVVSNIVKRAMEE